MRMRMRMRRRRRTTTMVTDLKRVRYIVVVYAVWFDSRFMW